MRSSEIKRGEWYELTSGHVAQVLEDKPRSWGSPRGWKVQYDMDGGEGWHPPAHFVRLVPKGDPKHPTDWLKGAEPASCNCGYGIAVAGAGGPTAAQIKACPVHGAYTDADHKRNTTQESVTFVDASGRVVGAAPAALSPPFVPYDPTIVRGGRPGGPPAADPIRLGHNAPRSTAPEPASIGCGATASAAPVAAIAPRFAPYGQPARQRTRDDLAELAERFPSLRLAGVARPWDADRVDRWAGGVASSGGAHAARFVLSVYNAHHEWPCGAFSVAKAYSVWDADHCAAFRSWVEEGGWLL